jgi:glycosyltransferase involved in cell wall biosynthesis
MTLPYITALIDTYNYGRFVEQAIESALHQDYPRDRLEILVIDDGSTDDTEDRIKRFGSRVQYVRKANGGQASAFNLGVQHSNGEIVALLDADDYWLPGKLKRVAEEFSANPKIGLVYHALRERNEALNVEQDLPFFPVSGWLADDSLNLLHYRVCPSSSLAFRSSYLRKIMPIPAQFRLQADLYITILVPFIAAVSAIAQPLTIYRLHGKNLYAEVSNSHTREQKVRSIALRREIIASAEQWLAANGIDIARKTGRLFFEQLAIFAATDEFELDPPGRLTFFCHLLRCNRLYGASGNWKLRMLNRANAAIALLTGYSGFNRVLSYEDRIRHQITGRNWGRA